MEKIVVSCLESRIDENQSVYSRFLLGPFLSGHAVTVATALRRALLSEVKNIAITALHIQGVTHEFSTIVGIRESVLELSLNFQQIILSTQIRTRNVQVGYLHVQGPAIVQANDLKLPDGIECVNPTQYIATISTEGLLVVKFLIGEKRSFLKSNTSTLNSKKIKEAKAYSAQLSKSLLSPAESDPPRLFRLLRNHSLPTGAIASHKPKVCAAFDKTNLLRTSHPRGSFEQSKGEVADRLTGTTFRSLGSGQVAFGDSKSKPNLVLQEQNGVEQNSTKVEFPFDNCRNEVPVAPKGLKRAGNKPTASAASIGSDQLLLSLGATRPWIALPERRSGSSRLIEHSRNITTIGVESNLDQSANDFFDEFNSEVCLRTIIPLDPIFTPVYQVNFGIERDDLSNKKRERVIMEVWTNGSIHPRQAINEAALSTISIFSKLRKSFQLDSHSLSLFSTSTAPVPGLARGSRLPKTKKSILKGRQLNDDPSESLKQEKSINFRRFALAKPSRTKLDRTSPISTKLISSLGFVRPRHPVALLLQNFGKSHIRGQAFLLEQSFGLKARFLKGHRVVLSKAQDTSEGHTLKKTFLPSFKAVLGLGTPLACSTVGLRKSSILGAHSCSAPLVSEQPKSNSNSRLPARFSPRPVGPSTEGNASFTNPRLVIAGSVTGRRPVRAKMVERSLLACSALLNKPKANLDNRTFVPAVWSNQNEVSARCKAILWSLTGRPTAGRNYVPVSRVLSRPPARFLLSEPRRRPAEHEQATSKFAWSCLAKVAGTTFRLPPSGANRAELLLTLGPPSADPCSASCSATRSTSKSYAHSSEGRVRPEGGNQTVVPATSLRPRHLLSFAEQVPRLSKKLSMQPKPILFLIKYKTFSFTRNALRVFGCRNVVPVSRVLNRPPARFLLSEPRRRPAEHEHATSRQEDSSFLLPLSKQVIRVKMAQVINSCLPLISKKSEPGLRFRFTGTQAITTVEGSHQVDVKQALLSLTRNALELQNRASSTYGSTTETDSFVQDALGDASLPELRSGICIGSIAPLGRLWLRSNLKKQFGFFQFACNELRAGRQGSSPISHTFFVDRAFLLTRLQGLKKHQDGRHPGFVQALPITNTGKFTESTKARSTLSMPERSSGYQSKTGSTKLLLSLGPSGLALGSLKANPCLAPSGLSESFAHSSEGRVRPEGGNRNSVLATNSVRRNGLSQPSLRSGNEGNPRAQHTRFAEGERGAAGTTFRQTKRLDLGRNVVTVSRFATSIASGTTLAHLASTPVEPSTKRSAVTGTRTVMPWEKRWMEHLGVSINRATLLPNQSSVVGRFVRAAFKKRKDLQRKEPTDLVRFARALLSQPRRRLSEQASYLRSSKRSWPKLCFGWPRKGLKPTLDFTTFPLMMTKVPPLCLSSGLVTLVSSTSEVASRLNGTLFLQEYRLPSVAKQFKRSVSKFCTDFDLTRSSVAGTKFRLVAPRLQSLARRSRTPPATSNKTKADQRCGFFKPARSIIEQVRRRYLEEREFVAGADPRGSSGAYLFGFNLDGNLRNESEVASLLTGTPYRPFQFTTQAGITLPLLPVSPRFTLGEPNEPVAGAARSAALVCRTINRGLPGRSFGNRLSDEGGQTEVLLGPDGRNGVPVSRVLSRPPARFLLSEPRRRPAEHEQATSVQHSQNFQFCARVTPRAKRLSILYSSNLDKMSFLSSDLANLSLSLKTYTFLKKKGKKNIASLLEYSPNALFSFLNGDKIMFHEIERCLSLLGLPFKERS